MYRNLSVRRLDENTYEQLRLRALARGVSMEEEARQILRNAVAAPQSLGDLFLKRFGPKKGVELVLPAHGPHEPPVVGTDESSKR